MSRANLKVVSDGMQAKSILRKTVFSPIFASVVEFYMQLSREDFDRGYIKQGSDNKLFSYLKSCLAFKNINSQKIACYPMDTKNIPTNCRLF